ncbi:hypothetical protein EFW58_02802 [Bacillus velezensis]|nr:hypothetical protein EFW58_02802 [Bacillus velezensis]
MTKPSAEGTAFFPQLGISGFFIFLKNHVYLQNQSAKMVR